MSTLSRFFGALILSALISGSAVLARAQEDRQYDPQTDAQATEAAPDAQATEAPAPDAQATESDAPARAARLQYMSGSVSVQPHGTDDWVTGTLNRPLTNSDNIWADKNSRAEISVGTGLIRIDSESSLTLTNISENTVQLQLHQGAMNLHVRRLYDNETYEVDTPNQAFTVLKPGDYRFDVDPNADKTVITIWRGEGQSTGDGPTVHIRAGQQARFTNGTSLTNDIHEAPAPDAFDQWASSRDERLDHSASARYVSPGVVGYEDLDEYGSWRNAPEYGPVWVPSGVPQGWAPYSYGHWIWVAPWGWTWVDDEPWGYAPFHYGRWVYWGGSWGWAPGPIYTYPYYAPALVAWFGGPGWGLSFGFGFGGGFGWCPLGWGEPFIPWYGSSLGYFRNVNVTNIHVTNVNNITNIYNNNFIHNRPKPVDPHHGIETRYANLQAPHGFTAVSRNTLVNSQPVQHNAVHFAPSQLGRMTSVRSPEIQPTRTSMLGRNAGRPATVPPKQAFARPVVSHIAPPAGSRGSFHPAAPAVATRPGAQQPGRNTGAERPTSAGINRSTVAPPASRMPERSTIASRPVPHPPNASGFDNRGSLRSAPGNTNERPSATQIAHNNVPRPPSATERGGMMPASPRNNVDRPAPVRQSAPAERPTERPLPSRSQPSVPRPSTPPSPRGSYSPGPARPSYSSPRAEVPRPAPSYEASRGAGYGRGSYEPPAPSYRDYGRSAPSYERAPSARPAPAYGGSYGRPAPSYSAGSYGRSAPSYGGRSYSGGRTQAYGGGGYGGGGRAPSYGGGYGGGHSSAPSHSSSGGSRSSGGSHGGRR